MVSVRYLVLLLALCSFGAHADEPRGVVFEKSASLASLYPAQEAQALSKVLPADRQLRWKVRLPAPTGPSGVLVFVSPTASGDPQPDWPEVLDQHHLIWIAAEDFGNPVPSNQRVLAALMALTLVEQSYPFDTQRRYIAGMSGGGRIASTTITRFPRQFTGALYIVGADFWTPAEKPLIAAIAANRYVFMTGSRDFNRREIMQVYDRYRAAGVQQALLIDRAGFGHEYPAAAQFADALKFLDNTQ